MKFGSQSSNINRISDNVFNTNVNAVEGANPIWQHSQSDFKSDGIQNDNIRSVGLVQVFIVKQYV